MYGLINMAIKQLVIDSHGEKTWNEVKDKAGISQNYFETLNPYDDKITYNLVFAISEVSGKSVEELLKVFGTYWLGYASKAGYEPLLKMFGPTFKECLQNLNTMHGQMGAMMPGLVPPHFEIETKISDTEFILGYTSQREGLAPMVYGLLEGLGQRYGLTNLEITNLGKSANKKTDRFLVKWN
jgi:hypothetical protein